MDRTVRFDLSPSQTSSPPDRSPDSGAPVSEPPKYEFRPGKLGSPQYVFKRGNTLAAASSLPSPSSLPFPTRPPPPPQLPVPLPLPLPYSQQYAQPYSPPHAPPQWSPPEVGKTRRGSLPEVPMLSFPRPPPHVDSALYNSSLSNYDGRAPPTHMGHTRRASMYQPLTTPNAPGHNFLTPAAVAYLTESRPPRRKTSRDNVKPRSSR